jgi:hypothetical protein
MARGTRRGTNGAAKKQWTVLVYMAGDNDLDSAGAADIAEMKAAGTTADVNVVVQFDRAAGATRRYLVRKGTPREKDVVSTLGETNCGDPAVLEDFVVWGAKSYPADHLLLVLWNHGAGWDDSNVYRGDAFGDAPPPIVRKGRTMANVRGRGAPLPLRQVRAALRRTGRALFRTTPIVAARTRGIAYDDDAQDFLDSVELKRVLASVRRKLGRNVDVLGMDACLMGMAEIAYQARGAADLLVGSQETEPNDGWPYERILKALAANPSMTPAQLAGAIVRQYLASYRPNEGVTQSATELGALPALASAVDRLAKALRAALASPGGRGAVLEARAATQEYSAPYDDYCDLGDLAGNLARIVPGADVASSCKAVTDALRRCVVASGAKGARVQCSTGLSIYFPRRRVSKLYRRLDFVRATAWGAFLRELVGARPPRTIAA